MKYTFGEMLRNCTSLVMTRLFYRKCRLIRFPIYIRNKRGITFGRGLTTGYGCRIDCEPKKECLVLGDNIRFGDRVHIVASEKVVIENDCLFASNIFVSDTDHGSYVKDSVDILTHPKDRTLYTRPVYIGSDCWIGENVCILKGSMIGKNCIIGANSVVNSNIPDYSIAVGHPAKVIKRFNCVANQWERVACDEN